MKLTSAEIKDLAEMAGFTVDSQDCEMDQEFIIQECSPGGIEDENGVMRRYAHIAWSQEYPEEGAMPLGVEIVSTEREHEASEDCWCSPELNYVDPDNGNKVFVHRQAQ